MYDGLLEWPVLFNIRTVAIADALHVLVLGEQCVADARHQHHSDEEGDGDFDRHGCPKLSRSLPVFQTAAFFEVWCSGLRSWLL